MEVKNNMWEYRHTNELVHSAVSGNPYYAPVYSDELYHYGVLGMKWGIRKQNETSGTGRVRGRKKLTNAQKQKIKKIAIGAGIGLGAAGAVTGAALLARKGIKSGTLRNARKNYAEDMGKGVYGAAKESVVGGVPALVKGERARTTSGYIRKVAGSEPITRNLPALRNKSKVARNIAIGVGATAATAGAGYGGYKGYQALQNKKKKRG